MIGQLDPATVAEQRRGYWAMGGGAALWLAAAFMPQWWLRLGLVGGGAALFASGMKQQLTAAVEAKVREANVPKVMARCAAQFLLDPNRAT